MNDSLVIPASILFFNDAVLKILFLSKIQAVLELPSVIKLFSSRSHASVELCSYAYCFARTGGNKFKLFISQRFHLRSLVVLTLIPLIIFLLKRSVEIIFPIIVIELLILIGYLKSLGATPLVIYK